MFKIINKVIIGKLQQNGQFFYNRKTNEQMVFLWKKLATIFMFSQLQLPNIIPGV